MKWENASAIRLGSIHAISGEEMNLQFKLFKIQRVAWFGFLFMIVASLMGFVPANGFVFSSAAHPGPTPAGVDYPHIVTWTSNATWKVKMRDPGAKQVWVSKGLLDYVNVESVWPRPASMTKVDEKLLLSFTEAPEQIVFKVKARSSGFVEGKIGSDSEAYSVGFLAIP